MAEQPGDGGRATGTVRCVIVTPETTTLDTRARSVTLPLHDGLRGVARGHAPFIGRLGVGEVRVVGERGGDGDAGRRLFVDGGFVEVSHDEVTVITQRSIAVERINAAEARAELERVRATRAAGDEAISAKATAERAARALVRSSTTGR
jgi:F-type H+-transporting ATPase subunit epsilon